VTVRNSRRTTAVAIAGAAAFALVATGCQATPSAPEVNDDWKNEKVTLTVATFNDFGYTEELLAGFTELYPNIKVEHSIAETSNDARTNYFTKLGAGSGLSDVEAVEVDWFPELMQYSDKLADLTSDNVEGRWLDWKTAAATDSEGRLVAYGTDIGPEAICYRADLFEAAGLPTDREEVAELLEGDWDNLRRGSRGELHALRTPRTVEPGLDRRHRQRRIRHDALPRLDARCHLWQRC
jgi:cellobiose transport system substrate-binding protein